MNPLCRKSSFTDPSSKNCTFPSPFPLSPLPSPLSLQVTPFLLWQTVLYIGLAEDDTGHIAGFTTAFIPLAIIVSFTGLSALAVLIETLRAACCRHACTSCCRSCNLPSAYPRSCLDSTVRIFTSFFVMGVAAFLALFVIAAGGRLDGSWDIKPRSSSKYDPLSTYAEVAATPLFFCCAAAFLLLCLAKMRLEQSRRLLYWKLHEGECCWYMSCWCCRCRVMRGGVEGEPVDLLAASRQGAGGAAAAGTQAQRRGAHGNGANNSNSNRFLPAGVAI